MVLKFFFNLPSLGFREFYKILPGSLIYFEIIFQETQAKFQDFENISFHLGFKRLSFTYFKPTNIQRWSSQMSIQGVATHKTIKFVIN